MKYLIETKQTYIKRTGRMNYSIITELNQAFRWKVSLFFMKRRFSFSVWNRWLLAMIERIKILQTVRKSYQAIGLDAMQSSPTPKACNQRILFIAFSMVQMFISTTAFLVFKARTILEYATSFYFSISVLFVLSTFFTLVTKMGNISKLTESFEIILEKSE